MKKATLLHGTDGSQKDHWFPWLKNTLEQNGYEVYAPELPENHTPNRDTYEKFLRDSGWDFTNNLLVGHSSGTTTILNMLMSDWLPKVEAAVLVGTFLNENLLNGQDWYTPGQFNELFVQEFDAEKIKATCPEFIFVHGDDDHACDYNDARAFCEKLDGEFITVPNGGHLSSSSGITELPQVVEKLKGKGLL